MFTVAVILAVLFACAAVAVLVTPRDVAYVEEATIAAPVSQVYDDIRFQARLMLWSAWPTETRSGCVVEGRDGEVGARTVFLRADGKRFGHQEVTALERDRRVELRLVGAGPPQRPVLTFELTPHGETETRVALRFRNRIPPPFNVILRLAGIVRWTRAMHRKDLDGLRRYSEPPHLTYAGEPALRPARPGVAAAA